MFLLGSISQKLVEGITFSVPSGVAPTPNVTFQYDPAGNRTSMSSSESTVSYSYDTASRLTSETRSFNGVAGSFSLNYSYNQAGQLTEITNPWGVKVGYNYNFAGEVTGVTGQNYGGVSTYASGLAYRAFGGLKQMNYGNGKSLSLGYNSRMFLTQWNIPGVMGWNYAYNYFNENTGRVTYAQNINDATLDRSYDYDQVGRLFVARTGVEARSHTGQSATGDYGPYSQHNDYDQFGNITARYGWGAVNPQFTAGYTNNRMNGMVYDAAGNLTDAGGGWTFTYDATGQQATSAMYNLQQYYDGDRLRAKKVESGVATYYLRSSVLGGQVVAEINASGALQRGYVYLGGQTLAVQHNGVYWMHEDPVAKSKRITDSAGNVVSTLELDPWGGETNRSSNEAFQPKKFTSYERDVNGSDEAMHRRYNRWWGRFEQPDPYDGSYNLTDPQSFNRYAYVQNDPVNFVDPSGLLPSDGQCQGAECPWSGGGGFWGGGYSGGSGWGGDPRPGISTIGQRSAQRDRLVQARIDGMRAQHYLNNGNFAAARRIFNNNSSVGLYQNGTVIWGEFASAFVEGYAAARQQLMLASGSDLRDIWKVTDLALRAMVSLGWRAVVNKISEIRGPDFQILNVNAIAGITRFVARGDDWASALQGVSAGGDAQISYAVGWMLQANTPSTRDIRAWGQGLSINADAFFVGGGGIVRSMSSPIRGVYVGFGAGGGWGASFQYPGR